VRTRRFVLLDRDGTLVVEKNYLSRAEDLELLPGALRALRLLHHLGLGLAVVTNQSGLRRGYFDQAALDGIHARLRRLLAEGGVHLTRILVCPHGPEDRCRCRKPEPGLVLDAAAELGFDPAASFVIGDKPCDVELGRRLGATTFLVRTGHGARFEREGTVGADHVVDDVLAAAQVIAARMRNETISR
jgi:D-glycero-D-manno-heptose 1,7-bisphosphate phosphatase